MRNLIRDVFNYCASSFAMGNIKRIGLYDHIVIINPKRRRDGYQTNL